ncbi:hypothetical protein BKA62DRAFT_825232 [Auriculariales sp. MPI-PUGE-AT-0066]|nr:hypothetical protein BKA62DRAFT_825232 [Auriculariales sp. MPI-PUGE-AT-0066]
MTTTSTPDLSSLTLRGDDYDPYQTSPAIIPGQSQPGYAQFNLQQQPKTSRGGLPNQWLEQNSPRSHSPPIANSSDISSTGGTSPPPSQSLHASVLAGAQTPALDDEVIPTAIVIKNIPFNVKRETLLDIIASLAIPTPYAFNYHLDPQGNFRGLAFANFRAAPDADAVVAALNGFDVQGRKLRVEYKKVLQAGEKERIEREKALRRMRSMQLEKEQIGTPYDDYGPIGTTPYSAAPSRPPFPTGNVSGYGFPPVAGPTSPPLLGNVAQQSSYLGGQVAPPFPLPVTTPGKVVVSPSTELDLNDPSTLEIYSRILLFKDDRMRDELAFSRSLAPKERRVVHLIAKKLGLYHYSVGEGAERYAVVTRVDPEGRQPTTTRPPQQTLHRAPSSYALGAHSPQEREDSVPSLRGKKSMPDMKTLHTASPRLTSRLSNGNIREGYATIAASSRRQPPSFGNLFGQAGLPSGGVPPVPAMPNALGTPTNGGAVTPGQESSMAAVMRQPRGPGNNTGFGSRQRVPTLESGRPGAGLEARSHEPLEI